MNDRHSTTGVLKKTSPFWWWVRANPSLVIGGLGIVISGAVGWHDLKSRISSVETKVDEIAHKPSAITDEQFSSLKGEFAQLRSDVDKQKGRWEQVDSVPQLHRARRK
jgi:hypothetical protein